MGCIGRSQIYGSSDAAYLNAQAAERIELYGLRVEYYSLNRGKNVDALYGEPTNDPLYGGTNPNSPLGTPQKHDLSWNFCPDIAQGDDSLVIPCLAQYVDADDRNPMVRPEGKVAECDATMAIANVHWECYVNQGDLVCVQGRSPKEGDVCYVIGRWWDVVKVGESESMFSSMVVTGYGFQLKKRTQFTPDRKVDL